MKKAVFGGGCFWCTEAVFGKLKGVYRVLPGYAGGLKEDATYDKVSSGKTRHAEVSYIEYDPNLVSYKNLLTVFFATHDPITYNRQGNDIGPQYRSIIFYTTPEQKEEAKRLIEEINNTNKEGEMVITELEPFEEFYPAESYHHNYYTKHSTAPYCQIVINPKLEKIQEKYAELLKEE